MEPDEEKSKLDSLIDASLRRVYDSVASEELPDRFVDLLRQLEAGEGPAVQDDAPADQNSAEG